ncbi:MAG: methyltransferase domain-containing protein [Christensenellaceae bacterium]|nr:methyltransferase domain-containing protein [Christensenellaceae bacterium]
MDITINKNIKGSILDIGGGGEGIIGQVYTSQVTAIDNRQEELDEAPDTFTKILMDACNLTFENESFDNVSAFYSLMYIPKYDHIKVIKEAFRVLKKGGSLHIWDCDIENAYPDAFVINLNISIPNKIIKTSYGIIDSDAQQNMEYFINLCKNCGFKLIKKENKNETFYLIFKK